MFNKQGNAPEIEFKSEKQWINSPPLTLENMKGKVVLLDFWTYSCVNCVRTLPALKKIWEKYKGKRFVLIGIHTPEFNFEKEIGNVKFAVKKYGIEYPILSDPERVNWENYGNTYWPRAALIDSEGKLIFEHIGEAGYDKIEEEIIRELVKLGEINSGTEKENEEKRDYALGLSRETYAGSLRGEEIPGKVCTKEGCDQYVDSGNYSPGQIYLHGDWTREPEFVQYMGLEGKGRICFRYYAKEVNVVMSGIGEAEVQLDNSPITKEYAGKDVFFKEGKSFVKMEGADMYNIVNCKAVHSRVLKIIPCEECKVYAYTFG